MKKVVLLLAVAVSVSFSFELVGTLSGFTNAQYCLPNGDYLYLLDGYNLYTIDVSEPSSPVFVDTLATSGYAIRMAMWNDYGFLGSGTQLLVLDLSDPAHPTELGSADMGTSNYVYGVDYHNGYVYVAATNVFKIFRFTPPATLEEVYSSTTYRAKTVSCWDHYCAIGGNDIGLMVFDISDPSSPMMVGGMPTPGFAVDVDFDHGRIYLADGAEVGVGTGHIILVEAPDFHTEAGRFTSTDGDCRHGCSYGTQYLVANGSYGFQLLDWTDASSPTVIDGYAFPTAGQYASDANIQFPYIYAVTRNQLMIFTSSVLEDTSSGPVGPSITLVEPAIGAASSCLGQPLTFVITDPDGVDWSTLRITINGFAYTIDDLYHNGDTVSFLPMIEYPDGDTIEYTIEAVSDARGTPSPDVPFSGYFVIDYSEPYVETVSPGDGDTLPVGTVDIVFNLRDDISGIDSSSPNFTFDSSPVEHGEMSWSPIEGGYQVTYSTDLSAAGFHTFCVMNLSDNAEYCGANTMPIFCWSFYVAPAEVDSTPPVVLGTEPATGTYTSCDDQTVTFWVSYDLEPSSVALDVNGETYTYASPQVDVVLDTFGYDIVWAVVFTPSESFADGETVRVELSDFVDTAGNSGEPVSIEFYVDLTPPQVSSVSPAEGETTSTCTPAIQAIIEETGSGVNADSLRFEINGEVVVPTVTLTGTGAIATYVPTTSFAPGEVVNVRVIGLQDSPDYCEPNAAEPYEWSFVAGPVGIAEGKLPQQIDVEIAPNPFNSACRITAYGVACPEIEIYDARGNLVATGTGQNFIWRPGENLPAGKYIVKIHGENFVGQTTVEYVK